MRKKNILIPSALAGVVGTATLLLKDEEKRERVKQVYQRTIAKVTGNTKEKEDQVLYKKIGHSEPYDFEDNKMVSEGAMYSVNHYNKAQDVKDEPLTMEDK